MIDMITRRRLYAEEIQAVANLKAPTVIDALATVERERFLPPGPWTIRSEADLQAPARQTPDADPRHVYHNLAVAIDSSRLLFNGAPSVVAAAIDALAPAPGARILHVGTGLGYYTAVLAQCVGPSGRVLGIEVDPELAVSARANLAPLPWTEVRQGDATERFGEVFDAILVNAGVTHPLPHWLDALAPRGRLMMPLTATFGPHPIGKGPLLLISRTTGDHLSARFTGFVAIYSAIGVRDAGMNSILAQAFSEAPFASVKSLRRDVHDQDSMCWVHAPGFCLSME